MKKVAIVGTVGIPACYGGFESLVENLTLYSSDNIEYTVFCSANSYSEQKKYHNNARLLYLPFKANGIQSVIYDIFSLIKCLMIKPDVILILGVSGCIFLPIFRLFSNSKIITNIDGLEWRRDKWSRGIRWFLKVSEHFAVRFSDIVVTDNKAIGDYVDSEYNVRNITIAYGGDHAIRKSNIDYINTPSDDGYALGLCRIEPENNVEMILEAFSLTSNQLKFVGNWKSSSYGISLRNKYQHYRNIELLDPIYDLDELYKLRIGSSLYLHGHSAGGTNPSLVEMMHFGKPIFAFDCLFNRYSTNNGAHFFKNASDILYLISTVNQLELEINGKKMKDLAIERYTWAVISQSYEEIYF
ncbi:TPA: DUF1972 domain-containing protein [Vibrio cholerae]|uniref:DUF1972 domain-containing protein n=1 Tax=Vibrio cholerae TaxID=666 RepID=UPI0028DA6CAC|nr:DUF1972 domain-containing protein [Vibrio cholerae]ELJ8509320.1 DUF1972 domain-containing protein [Vibrio cholerae]HDZ9238162.1 DUF1972 domain-containing protein [Vibrio cholerae]